MRWAVRIAKCHAVSHALKIVRCWLAGLTGWLRRREVQCLPHLCCFILLPLRLQRQAAGGLSRRPVGSSISCCLSVVFLCSCPICSGGRLVDYRGDRSARHLKDWALSLLPKHVKSVHKEAQLVRCRHFGFCAVATCALLWTWCCKPAIKMMLHHGARMLHRVYSAAELPFPTSTGRLFAAVPGGRQGGCQVGRVRAAAQVRLPSATCAVQHSAVLCMLGVWREHAAFCTGVTLAALLAVAG